MTTVSILTHFSPYTQLPRVSWFTFSFCTVDYFRCTRYHLTHGFYANKTFFLFTLNSSSKIVHIFSHPMLVSPILRERSLLSLPSSAFFAHCRNHKIRPRYFLKNQSAINNGVYFQICTRPLEITTAEPFSRYHHQHSNTTFVLLLTSALFITLAKWITRLIQIMDPLEKCSGALTERTEFACWRNLEGHWYRWNGKSSKVQLNKNSPIRWT